MVAYWRFVSPEVRGGAYEGDGPEPSVNSSSEGLRECWETVFVRFTSYPVDDDELFEPQEGIVKSEEDISNAAMTVNVRFIRGQLRIRRSFQLNVP